jgi:hypothetical protein
MDISLSRAFTLLRDVIENEHGGKVYDDELQEYMEIDWEGLETALSWGLSLHEAVKKE